MRDIKEINKTRSRITLEQEIDNCVVCGKYLKEIGEQENAMCDKCNRITEEVANKVNEEKGWNYFKLPENHTMDDLSREIEKILKKNPGKRFFLNGPAPVGTDFVQGRVTYILTEIKP